MDEAARTQRNTQRLETCFPPFATVMRRVLDTLEAQGFRPRIQDAWRSPEDQMHAFTTGKSGLKFGFHNATGAGGAKEALACDVLDDADPLAPSTRYLLALTLAAQSHGLDTGILWKLSADAKARVQAALAARDLSAAVKLGFDPTHVEITGLSVAAVRDGARPAFTGVPSTQPSPATSTGGRVHVVKPGDNLSKIAKLHGTTLARIIELNPQFAADPGKIKPGQQVLLD